MPLKVSQIIKLVEADGWQLLHQKGSHRQYRHATKPGKVTIAGRPSVTLPLETERSILTQAGLPKRR